MKIWLDEAGTIDMEAYAQLKIAHGKQLASLINADYSAVEQRIMSNLEQVKQRSRRMFGRDVFGNMFSGLFGSEKFKLKLNDTFAGSMSNRLVGGYIGNRRLNAEKRYHRFRRYRHDDAKRVQHSLKAQGLGTNVYAWG